MSFSSHRKAVLDESRPLSHRASHARSCALHVANKLGIRRDAVLHEVAARTGVDLNQPSDAEQLLKAFALLEALRQGSLELPWASQDAADPP